VSDPDLGQLAVDALEQMAFVFVEPSDGSAAEVMSEAAASALLVVDGQRPHAITVSATAGLVQEVASGMTGCAPGELDAVADAAAVVAELANVFSGEWARQRVADGGVVQVGLPQALSAASAADWVCRAVERGVVVALESEEGALVVTLSAA